MIKTLVTFNGRSLQIVRYDAQHCWLLIEGSTVVGKLFDPIPGTLVTWRKGVLHSNGRAIEVSLYTDATELVAT